MSLQLRPQPLTSQLRVEPTETAASQSGRVFQFAEVYSNDYKLWMRSKSQTNSVILKLQGV